jgi:hypothetical protein
MPIYITADDVKVRTAGKVRYTDSFADENKMPNALLVKLIDEAEAQVEQDLSPRYATPFVNVTGGAFATLPDRPTKLVIRTLCELAAVMRVLQTDFGKGTAVEGDKYYESLQKQYDQQLRRAIGRNDEGETHVGKTGPFTYPPLLGLALAPHNSTDDGYVGAVLNSSMDNGGGNYPAKQIVDPSETWWNGELDP